MRIDCFKDYNMYTVTGRTTGKSAVFRDGWLKLLDLWIKTGRKNSKALF